MNAIENLQLAQEKLEADYRQRMAALVKEQERVQKVIDKNVLLEAAQREAAEAKQAQAQAIDALDLTMTPVLGELGKITGAVEKMKAEVASCHARLTQMAQLQKGLFGRLGTVAREIGIAASANRGAFADDAEMQRWVATKIRELIPLSATAVTDNEMPFKQRELYGFRGFGTREQEIMIGDALRSAR